MTNLIPSELAGGLQRCARSLTRDAPTAERVVLEVFERIRKLPDACDTIGCDGRFVSCESTLAVSGQLSATLEVVTQFHRVGAKRVTVADVRRCALKAQASVDSILDCELFDSIEYVALEDAFQCTFELTVRETDVEALCASAAEREVQTRKELQLEMVNKRSALLLDSELARAKVIAEQRSLASAVASHTRGNKTRSTRRSKRGAKLRQLPVRTIEIPSIGTESSFARHLARKEKAIARIRSAGMLSRASAYVRSLVGLGEPAKGKDSPSEFGLSHAGDADLFEGI